MAMSMMVDSMVRMIQKAKSSQKNIDETDASASFDEKIEEKIDQDIVPTWLDSN